MKLGSPFGSKQNERRKRKRERDYKKLCLKLREEARAKAEAERCLSPPPRGLYVIKTIRRDGSLTQGGCVGLPCYQDMVNMFYQSKPYTHQWSNIIVRDPTCTDLLMATTSMRKRKMQC